MNSLSERREPGLYVIDQNFPVLAATPSWPELKVVRLGEIASGLTASVDDWEILLELQHRGDVSGFVTNDARILDSARELTALCLTSLTLVAADGVGDDALKATGLVMLHLGDIHRDTANRPMTYRLRPSSKTAMSPGALLTRVAARNGQQTNVVISNERRTMASLLARRRPHLLPLLPSD